MRPGDERHELDPIALLAGLAFASIAAVQLLDIADWLEVDQRWLWPALLIGLGLFGLIAALRPDPPAPEGDEPAQDGPP